MGFTNLGPDVTDLYLEKVTGDTYLVGTTRKPVTKRTETIKVAGGGDVSIVVLRWTALTPGRTMDAVSALNTAQTWEELRKAAALFEVPAQNLIFASVDATIGYQAPGRIPVRTGYDGTYPALGWDPRQTWSGYIPFDALPNVKNPDDGWVVTANQASIYKEYPYFITDDWTYGARVNLTGNSGHTYHPNYVDQHAVGLHERPVPPGRSDGPHPSRRRPAVRVSGIGSRRSV